MDSVETTQESLEHAHHAAEHPTDYHAKQAALLIGMLAAALALCEMQEKQAQNAFLESHIAASDTWSFFQAKNIRATIAAQTATVLGSLPGAADDAAIQKRIADAHDAEARMRSEPTTGEGTKELAAKARALEEEREHNLHRYHHFEWVNGVLQISIVLASVSVVTRIRRLAWVAGTMGAIAAVSGLLLAIGVI
jgi:hypothetical protein